MKTDFSFFEKLCRDYWYYYNPSTRDSIIHQYLSENLNYDFDMSIDSTDNLLISPIRIHSHLPNIVLIAHKDVVHWIVKEVKSPNRISLFPYGYFDNQEVFQNIGKNGRLISENFELKFLFDKEHVIKEKELEIEFEVKIMEEMTTENGDSFRDANLLKYEPIVVGDRIFKKPELKFVSEDGMECIKYPYLDNTMGVYLALQTFINEIRAEDKDRLFNPYIILTEGEEVGILNLKERFSNESFMKSKFGYRLTYFIVIDATYWEEVSNPNIPYLTYTTSAYGYTKSKLDYILYGYSKEKRAFGIEFYQDKTESDYDQLFEFMSDVNDYAFFLFSFPVKNMHTFEETMTIQAMMNFEKGLKDLLETANLIPAHVSVDISNEQNYTINDVKTSG